MAGERIAVAALRRQRQIEVQVDKYTLVLEIPTDRKFFQVIESHPGMSDALLNCELVKMCLVGWKGVKDSDLLSSGTEDEAVFDAAVAGEWLDDHAEWWGPAADALIKARNERKGRAEADAKN